MSAWIVTKTHVDVLVAALLEYRLIDRDEADQVGAELWAENYASINYRYDEDTAAPSYSFEEPSLLIELDDLGVLKQVHCYNYQSCEHDDWRASRVYRRMTALEAAITLKLGSGELTKSRAYDAAPWGV